MNELSWGVAPRYVPTKFDPDQRRIAHERPVMGLAVQNN